MLGTPSDFGECNKLRIRLMTPIDIANDQAKIASQSSEVTLMQKFAFPGGLFVHLTKVNLPSRPRISRRRPRTIAVISRLVLTVNLSCNVGSREYPTANDIKKVVRPTSLNIATITRQSDSFHIRVFGWCVAGRICCPR